MNPLFTAIASLPNRKTKFPFPTFPLNFSAKVSKARLQDRQWCTRITNQQTFLRGHSIHRQLQFPVRPIHPSFHLSRVHNHSLRACTAKHFTATFDSFFFTISAIAETLYLFLYIFAMYRPNRNKRIIRLCLYTHKVDVDLFYLKLSV